MDILWFLAEHNARITHHDMWLIVEGEGEGEYTFTVYRKQYGRKTTEVLYEGNDLSSALKIMEQ